MICTSLVNTACVKECIMKLNVAFAFALAVAAAPTLATTNLVTNGGFETTTFTTSSEVGISGFAQGVTGWISNGYNLLYKGGMQTTTSATNQYNDPLTYFRPNVTVDPRGTGGNFMALDGDSGIRGALTQSISGLTTGQQYYVNFDWAAAQLRNRTGATTEQLQVSLGGPAQSTQLIANPSAGFSGWTPGYFAFTAPSSTAVLSFLSIGTPDGQPPIALLDNVSLQAVPEPATWALFIVGFGLVGAAARRRRTTVVTA